jgi:hypothetical protein
MFAQASREAQFEAIESNNKGIAQVHKLLLEQNKALNDDNMPRYFEL